MSPNEDKPLAAIFDDKARKGQNQFILVNSSEIQRAVKLLEQRLPESGSVYNCALRLSRHLNEFPLYAFNPNSELTQNKSNSSAICTLTDSTWFVVVQTSQDYSQYISIAAPKNPNITPEIKHAFINTNAFDWDKPFYISAVERAIMGLIMDISTNVKGNGTLCNPHRYYVMDPRDALSLQIEQPISSAEQNSAPIPVIQRLDTTIGAEFITKQWKYTKDGTLQYAKDMISRNPSCGIYIDKKPVSAVLTHAPYLVGMLATDKEHRGKGYAITCMKTLLKCLAEEGYLPSSTVEDKNIASNAFHCKVGMKFTHKCDDIFYMGSNW